MERPFRHAGKRREADLAEAAETDFRNQETGIEPALGRGPGIDQSFAARAFAWRDAQAVGLGDEPFDEGSGA